MNDSEWTRQDRWDWWRIKLYHLLPCAIMAGCGRVLQCTPAMLAAGAWAIIGFFLDFHVDGDEGFRRIARINGIFLAVWAVVAGSLLAFGAFDAEWGRPAAVAGVTGLASLLYLIARPNRWDARRPTLD